MGRFSEAIVKLTYHGAMISYLRVPLQGTSCYQWRTDELYRSLSRIRISCSLKFVGREPQFVPCREWFGRKVGQWRCGVSNAAGVGQVRAAPKFSYEELGRYGIVETDYVDVMTSPQRPQSGDKHGKRSSDTVSKSKIESGFGLEHKIDTVEIHATTSNDNDEVEVNDWCAYLMLSHDKRKTYLGVTANVMRRVRQHNGELVGGAKAVRGGRPWSLVCTVRGFGTRSEACQFEWRLRKFSKGYLKVHETLSEEVPLHYQDSHVVLRRWAAVKKVHEATEDWKHVRVEWY